MTSTTLHDAEVAFRFDSLAGRFKAAVDSVDYRLAAIAHALAPLERPAILDLGCGKGRFARHLERTASNVVGIDLSSRMLAETHGLKCARANGTRLPFADASFDAAIAVETLEHVRNVDQFLDEARRVLRPDGRLIIVDKNACSLNHIRPWLPSLMVKWIDERRGRWMYPAGGLVRERWFVPGRMCKLLRTRFESASCEFLLSPSEAEKPVFRMLPRARLMVCWTAVVPGGEQ